MTSEELRASLLQREETTIDPVPEIPGVFVRSLTDKEYSDFEAKTLLAKNEASYAARVADARRRLIILSACDEHKNPIFLDTDVKALESVHTTKTLPIYNAAVKKVGARQGDVEELVKNSESTGGS